MVDPITCFSGGSHRVWGIQLANQTKKPRTTSAGMVAVTKVEVLLMTHPRRHNSRLSHRHSLFWSRRLFGQAGNGEGYSQQGKKD